MVVPWTCCEVIVDSPSARAPLSLSRLRLKPESKVPTQIYGAELTDTNTNANSTSKSTSNSNSNSDSNSNGNRIGGARTRSGSFLIPVSVEKNKLLLNEPLPFERAA